MTTISSLDVTHLFPFPSELAARPAAPASPSEPPGAVSAAPLTEPTAAEAAPDSNAQLAASLQQLNAGLGHRGIEFEFSEPGNHLVTRVIDRDSGELIRQIPSEEVLRMAQRMDDLRGLLLQTQA